MRSLILSLLTISTIGLGTSAVVSNGQETTAVDTVPATFNDALHQVTN